MTPLVTLDPTPHLPFLARSLEEDVGRGDLTSLAIVPEDARGTADIVSHAAGIMSGLPLVEPLLRILDPDGVVECAVGDGDRVAEGSVVATLTGKSRALLTVERTALNVLRRLSGIATATAAFVEAAAGSTARIYDTRKTMPGWRDLEKYAVRCGGGENHRLRLDDAAMIKENHLLAAFGRTGPEAIVEAVRRARERLRPGTTLYVEVESQEELKAVADEAPDVVLLDGFDIGALRQAVRWVRARSGARPLLEATGGVTLENVEAVAATGVDRISVGALTHSAPALDLSMRFRGA